MKTYRKMTVIGLGLIGSSIARKAHKLGIASTICGVDSNELSLSYARKQGFIDQVSMSAADAVDGSDIVIIATPTHLLEDICKAIAPKIAQGTLVMDTGSVKQIPLALMSEHLPVHALIVPAHPIAGSEQSGVGAGRDDLFEKKRVIITPSAPLTHAQLQEVNTFWTKLGARVEAMPADMHDTLYGYVSHLPQLLAFAVRPLVHATDAELSASDTLSRFMRLGRSDISLWCGIFLLNRDVVTTATNRYLDVISHIRKELASAPEGTPSEDADIARTALFPRIISSCLITTVMEAEKKSGVVFARFAGTGFADFTSPSTTEPEGDLEHISNHYAQITQMLAALELRLGAIEKALQDGDAVALAKALE